MSGRERGCPVRNLALFNGATTIVLTIYALFVGMPRADIVQLVLVAVLSAIPVALPSMFALAGAFGKAPDKRTDFEPPKRQEE